MFNIQQYHHQVCRNFFFVDKTLIVYRNYFWSNTFSLSLSSFSKNFFYLFKIKSKLTKSLCMCYASLHFALTYGTILTLSWRYYLPRVNLFTHANCESYHYTLDCVYFTGISDASTASYSNICAETLGGMSMTQLCAEVLWLFLWLGKWIVCTLLHAHRALNFTNLWSWTREKNWKKNERMP